jgi:cytochrome c553
MPPFARAAVIFLPLLGPLPALAETDAGPGAKIAAQGTSKGVAPCMTCHGPDGAGIAPAGYPRITGLDAAYLAKQLRDCRGGKRRSAEGRLLGEQPAR